ncbi:hypothetical protein GNP73_07970 [Aliivibrio fischeri]|uniref:hypothetical protein n=1 Tax=Aliivibrio fischeri TaxID=668 RepID=UPI0012DA3569|nr:hypothetical protein [Aliivibrio fischeri]MUJ27914.1 hypothetical protein [Aliivibrio fischeri]
MSWQSDFDASGPRWEGNASQLRENERMQEHLEKSKIKVKATKPNLELLQALDNQMKVLYLKEKSILTELESSMDKKNDVLLKELHELRKQFSIIKNKFLAEKAGRITVNQPRNTIESGKIQESAAVESPYKHETKRVDVAEKNKKRWWQFWRRV